MTRQELIDAFSLEGINRANAVVNFKEAIVERAPSLVNGAAPAGTVASTTAPSTHVILSGVETSRSEVSAESKDPYPNLIHARGGNSPCLRGE
jgi:hypothetical protein